MSSGGAQRGLLSPPLGSSSGGSSSRFQTLSSVSNAQQDTEVAFAELQLLSQNQRKLASLTTRMTTILSGFDKRLIKLESSILPVHRGTQKLARMSDNIDLTLAALNKTLGHYDVVMDEQPIIKAGPDVRDTTPYMETIDRVIKGLDYLRKSDLKSQDGVMKKMNDLIELGARNLTDVVRDWVTANSEVIDLTEYSPRSKARHLQSTVSLSVHTDHPISTQMRTTRFSQTRRMSLSYPYFTTLPLSQSILGPDIHRFLLHFPSTPVSVPAIWTSASHPCHGESTTLRTKKSVQESLAQAWSWSLKMTTRTSVGHTVEEKPLSAKLYKRTAGCLRTSSESLRASCRTLV